MPKVAPPTSVMPKYNTDGKGRDSFITFADRNPPQSLKACTLPSSKVASSKHPALPKFIPSGTGRDLFCQVQKDQVIPFNGKTPSTCPNPTPKSHGSGVIRQVYPPTYQPSGTGRDLYFTRNENGPFPGQSHSFKIASYQKNPRPRTSPPPRFQPHGIHCINHQPRGLISIC